METPPPLASFATPISYRGVDADRPAPRPGAVTVIAILGIVWGGLEGLASIEQLIRYVGVLNRILSGNSARYMTHYSVLYPRFIALIVVALTAVVALLLVPASIAALRMARWARRGMLCWVCAYAGVTIIWIIFRTRSFWWINLRGIPGSPVVPVAMNRVNIWLFLRSILMDWVRMAGVILAVCVIRIFSSKKVKAAFIRRREIVDALRKWESSPAAPGPGG